MAATKAQYRLRAALLLIPFIIVLVLLFLPLYPLKSGKKVNGLDYFDNFFNEVSKYSSFGKEVQAKQMKVATSLADLALTTTIKMKGDKKANYSPEDAAQTAVKLLTAIGFQATAEGEKVKMSGDLPTLAKAVVQDSIDMYNNNKDETNKKTNILEGRYSGLDPKQALYTWYQVMDSLNKSLTKDGNFEAAKTMKNFMTKAIEPAYNYYGVEITTVKEEMLFLAFALIFYVVYTVWYGFGIMYLFEGLGVVLDH